jgi:hypothetical protein
MNENNLDKWSALEVKNWQLALNSRIFVRCNRTHSHQCGFATGSMDTAQYADIVSRGIEQRERERAGSPTGGSLKKVFLKF